jgi:two-component system, chemotaxis family, chemotaxis protein CheY
MNLVVIAQLLHDLPPGDDMSLMPQGENPGRGRNRMSVDVMIVDDSAAIRKILRRVLQQAEVPVGQVHEASDGLEALEVLKSNMVQLVLCDINMPNMDGIELLGRVKAMENLRSVPVIMVTTEGSQARVMQALELGAAGYVKKPFTADQIKEKLTGII